MMPYSSIEIAADYFADIAKKAREIADKRAAPVPEPKLPSPRIIEEIEPYETDEEEQEG